MKTLGREGGPSLEKKFSHPFGPQFGPKTRRAPGPGPPSPSPASSTALGSS